MKPINVAVVEDDARLRRTVAEVLASAPDFSAILSPGLSQLDSFHLKPSPFLRQRLSLALGFAPPTAWTSMSSNLRVASSFFSATERTSIFLTMPCL